jgi:hypothetical protein
VGVNVETVDDGFKTVSFVCGVLIQEGQERRLGWEGDFNENEFTVDLGYYLCGEEVCGCEGEGCGC